MARERRLFSEEFKREAVKLVGQPGASKAGIARDLGVGTNLLGRWCREANVDGQVGGGKRFLPRSMSACGVNWQKLRRSAIY